MFHLDLVNIFWHIFSFVEWKLFLFFVFQENGEHSSIAILNVLLLFLCGLSGMFPYCYFGELATESFENMCDCVVELNWQKMPIELQKYIVLMVSNMQAPLHYHGFHVATLELGTFVNVSRFYSFVRIFVFTCWYSIHYSFAMYFFSPAIEDRV